MTGLCDGRIHADHVKETKCHTSGRQNMTGMTVRGAVMFGGDPFLPETSQGSAAYQTQYVLRPFKQ